MQCTVCLHGEAGIICMCISNETSISLKKADGHSYTVHILTVCPYSLVEGICQVVLQPEVVSRTDLMEVEVKKDFEKREVDFGCFEMELDCFEIHKEAVCAKVYININILY